MTLLELLGIFLVCWFAGYGSGWFIGVVQRAYKVSISSD